MILMQPTRKYTMQPQVTGSNLSNWLRGIILAKGYHSIQEFADKLGVDRSYVSQIINNLRPINREMKIRIAKELGMDTLEIFPEKK